MNMPTIGILLSAHTALLVSPPGYPGEVASLVEVNIKAPLPCSLDGFTNAPRKVNVGCSEQQLITHFANLDNSIHRVFFVLCGLDPAHEIEDLIFVPLDEAPLDCHLASRVLVRAAMTSAAQRFTGIVVNLRRPAPAALAIDSTASGASRRFLELAGSLNWPRCLYVS
jgi:hypothetical protein